ncbi:hypothetical protein [Tenacibaculum aestuarii]|uniref:hypothetical protein n=1 Tax=Tenacibaculum aestuarii TaxID=362781 RepID=UPI0038B68E6F
MFNWYKVIGINEALNNLRKYTIPYAENIPRWVLFSLPDGLWIFSYICLILFIWKNYVSLKNIFWILIIPVLAVCSELGQLFSLIKGTFDFTDLVLYSFGMTLPFIFFKKSINYKLQIS